MPWHERQYYRDPSDGGGGGLFARLSGHSVVAWLLGINAAVFVLDLILGGGRRTQFELSTWGQFTVEDAIYHFQVWRWLTYQFLHGGFFHLLFNMIALFFFGPLMEQWWGSRRFLAFYLICGVSGAAIYSLIVLLMPGLIFDVTALQARAPAAVPVVGASGAIFGILIGAAVLFPHQRVMLLFPPIPMSLRTLALIILGIAVLSLLTGTPNAGGEAAHLGGAALGWLLVRRPHWLDWADRLGLERASPERLRQKHQQGRVQRRRQKEAEEAAEVDRILDKVKNQGLHSLTKREKKILNRATERQRQAR